ncbi:MAG TPA: isochorismate synthase [Acidimicrobiales bacterium]|nr:isochorismate synthase [Acidimicrobiales bacterium]
MTTHRPLRAVERPISPAQARLLRQLAFASGLVVERDGCALAGIGEALTLSLPAGLGDPAGLDEATGRLRAVSAEPVGAGSPGAVAVGALAFLPGAPGYLTVPEVTVLATEPNDLGTHPPSAVVVAPEGAHDQVWEAMIATARREAGAASASPPPDSFRLESARSHADFLERVAQAVGEVRSGRLDKVVLAREVVVEANRPLRQADLLERLRSLHPSCTTFAVDGFVGATPELLVRRRGAVVESDPLAGTAARSGDPEADRAAEAALFSSEKERAEHRTVVTAIGAALAPVVDELEVPTEPGILELRNVSHLHTKIRGRLRPLPARAELPSALELAALVHPTPAVSGYPVDLALEYLAKAEDLDRGRYAGPVGFVRANGDGELHLGIRSAFVDGTVARLLAGVGIVADSQPEAELRETQLKLQALLAAAVRP